MKKTPTEVTCYDIKGTAFQVASSQLTFRPAVYGVVIENDNILLSKQWDGYDFPGGGIELGELTEDALQREVKEETGLEVTVGKLVQASSSFFKLPFKNTFVHSIHLYYACEVCGGELSTEHFDEQEKKYADMPEWVSLSKIPSITVYSSVNAREIIDLTIEKL
jgi:ADP-ribose pyrophosphatase YjhB (NUDIX family)